MELGLVGVLSLLVVWGYARYIEPEWVQTTRFNLTLPRLAPEFDGYRVVQFSDLHVDSWLGGERLAKIVALVNAEKPDTVVITGDFVGRRLTRPHADDLRRALSLLAPADVTVAVLGNHDYKVNIDLVNEVILQSGLVNVSNHYHTLRRGRAVLHFAGVDSKGRKKYRLDKLMQKLPEEGAAILLAHEPDTADENAAVGRFDLQLSGHTHGGQVRLPFLGAPSLPRYGTKYPAGLYKIQTMLLYTNRGVGMGIPRIRLNCRPEITVFTLYSGLKK